MYFIYLMPAFEHGWTLNSWFFFDFEYKIIKAYFFSYKFGSYILLSFSLVGMNTTILGKPCIMWEALTIKNSSHVLI